MASTSEELASQADLLQSSISFFRLGESGRPVAGEALRVAPGPRTGKSITLRPSPVAARARERATNPPLGLMLEDTADAEFEQF